MPGLATKQPRQRKPFERGFVGKKSKTKLPECSEASSVWGRARAAGAIVPAMIFQILARCRAIAAGRKRAELLGAGGHVERAAEAGRATAGQGVALARRVAGGAPVGVAARQAAVAGARAKLEAARAARAPAKAEVPQQVRDYLRPNIERLQERAAEVRRARETMGKRYARDAARNIKVSKEATREFIARAKEQGIDPHAYLREMIGKPAAGDPLGRRKGPAAPYVSPVPKNVFLTKRSARAGYQRSDLPEARTTTDMARARQLAGRRMKAEHARSVVAKGLQEKFGKQTPERVAIATELRTARRLSRSEAVKGTTFARSAQQRIEAHKARRAAARAPKPAAPSLREQVAAHRAAKGTREERLKAIVAKHLEVGKPGTYEGRKKVRVNLGKGYSARKDLAIEQAAKGSKEYNVYKTGYAIKPGAPYPVSRHELLQTHGSLKEAKAAVVKGAAESIARRAARLAGGGKPEAPLHEQAMAAAARVPASKRHGESKVFLHHAHEEYQKAGGKLSLEEFKRQLVESPAARMRLARADMVHTMNREDVRKSNVTYRAGANEQEYNFLKLGAGKPAAPAQPAPGPTIKEYHDIAGNRTYKLRGKVIHKSKVEALLKSGARVQRA
jgi:hypothetical protein